MVHHEFITDKKATSPPVSFYFVSVIWLVQVLSDSCTSCYEEVMEEFARRDSSNSNTLQQTRGYVFQFRGAFCAVIDYDGYMKASLQRVIDLQTLLLKFNRLERTLLLPATEGRPDRNETDTEHSYSLAMAAWYLAKDLPHLDTDKCLRYALVHDLPEIDAGDTFAYDKSQTAHSSKADREQEAIACLKEHWPDFAEMTASIEGYEARKDPESRFVYALDKLMPMVVNHLSGGKNYRKHRVTLNDVKEFKAKKVAVSPEIQTLYHDMLAIFEMHPEYFVQTEPGKLSDDDYLKKAVHLGQQSIETVGCGVVIVSAEGEILAEAYNSQEVDGVAVHHAEIKAIVAANRKTGSRKLKGAIAYCSCEPCAMCLAALSYAKVDRIIFRDRMADLFPDDPQSQFDSHVFVAGLNFKPKLQQFTE